MKRFILFALCAAAVLPLFLVTGCVREELPDNRDTEYGYIQFKLYKEASYGKSTKAVVDQIEELSQASKISVTLMNSDNQTIIQTLTLSAHDGQSAEFGLRSAKLKLLKGDYQLVNYTLYDNLDSDLYRKAVGSTFTIVPGGLEVFDLTANVVPRGMIKFNLVKDLSGLLQDPDNPQLDNPALRTSSMQRVSQDRREYTFDEIESMDITLVNLDNIADKPEFKGLPVEFSEHFKGDEHYDGKEGVSGTQSSSSVADTVLYVNAGRYNIYSYSLYDESDLLLETQNYSSDYDTQEEITVTDNELTEADVLVTLVEADEYLQDGYALYLLWKALDGEHWSYEGQTWPRGSNWNFNKDVDLWCDQPGVEIHPNGRVASIDLSGFGISGNVPAAIGQFDQLVQLSFGNHNETNAYLPQYDLPQMSRYPVDGTAEEKAEWMEEKYRRFSDQLHPGVQMSPACALALRLNGRTSGAAAFYDNMTTDEIAAMAAEELEPADFQIRPYDMNHGKLTNNLTGIHENIRYLTRLESLTIANSPITKEGFPSAEAFAQLSLVSELVIYNCPELTELPAGIERMGGIVQANISNNGFTATGAEDALNRLATGASEDMIQILYFLQNNLETLPVEVGEMGRLGMLDVSYNSISGDLPAFGNIATFTPEELHFDNNAIESVPDNFCSLDDLTTFTISNNKLEYFPNFFTSDKDAYVMSSIDVSSNDIKSLAPESGSFNGIRTKTLTLSGNPIKSFPKELGESDSYVEYILMQQCGMTEFPEGCLDGEFTSNLTSLDLQYNNLTELPEDFNAEHLPYLYGVDLSYNSFAEFPWEPLNSWSLTVYAVRGQRASMERCLREWPTGIYQHTGLRGLYLGSNDLRVISDTISQMIFYLDISDNPNISFDASDICAYWQAGAYNLFYDQSQDIKGCDAMKY